MEQKILEKLESMDVKFSDQLSALDTKFSDQLNTLDVKFSSEFKKVNKTLDVHTKTLNRHTKILDEHSKILTQHSKTLNEHSKILNGHNKILNEHTEQIDFIANKVAEHDTDIQEIKIYLKEEVATKKDLERIYTSLDEILSHVKKNDQEITFMGNRITRLEKQASTK